MDELITQDIVDSWKREINSRLKYVSQNFVAIGFRLRQIKESGMAGDIFELAQKEWGLSKSTTSRFIAINEKYSKNGYSEELDDRYNSYKYSQLQEMLTLPEQVEELVTPSSTISDIRTVKEYAKDEEEQKDGVQQSLFEKPVKQEKTLQTALLELLKERKVFNSVITALAMGEDGDEQLKETLNPSGSRTHRHGLILLAFSEAKMTVKKFGKPDESYSYAQLRRLIQELWSGIDHMPSYEEIYPEELKIQYEIPAKKEYETPIIEEMETEQEEEPQGQQEDKKTETENATPPSNLRGEPPVATSQLPRVEGEIVINEPKEEQKYQGELSLSYEEGSKDANQVTDSPADVVPHENPPAGSTEGIDGKKERFLELTRADRASYADALQFMEMDSACFLDGRNVNLELMERHEMKLEQMRGKLGRMMRDWRTIYGD